MTSMFRRATLIRTPLVDIVRSDHAPGTLRHGTEEERELSHAITFVEAGEFGVGAGAHDWLLRERGLLISRPGAVYRYTHARNAVPDVCLTVRFASGFDDACERELSAAGIAPPAPNHTALLRWRLPALLDAGDAMAVDAWSAELLAALRDRRGDGDRLHRPSQLRWYAERVEAARATLERRYAEPHTLASLAASVAISPFQFARVFRQLPGRPPPASISDAGAPRRRAPHAPRQSLGHGCLLRHRVLQPQPLHSRVQAAVRLHAVRGAPGAGRRLASSQDDDADQREEHGESGECGRRKRGHAGQRDDDDVERGRVATVLAALRIDDEVEEVAPADRHVSERCAARQRCRGEGGVGRAVEAVDEPERAIAARGVEVAESGGHAYGAGDRTLPADDDKLVFPRVHHDDVRRPDDPSHHLGSAGRIERDHRQFVADVGRDLGSLPLLQAGDEEKISRELRQQGVRRGKVCRKRGWRAFEKVPDRIAATIGIRIGLIRSGAEVGGKVPLPALRIARSRK